MQCSLRSLLALVAVIGVDFAVVRWNAGAGLLLTAIGALLAANLAMQRFRGPDAFLAAIIGILAGSAAGAVYVGIPTAVLVSLGEPPAPESVWFLGGGLGTVVFCIITGALLGLICGCFTALFVHIGRLWIHHVATRRAAK